VHHAIGIKNAPVFTSKTDDFHKKKIKYGAPLTSSPAAYDTIATHFQDTGRTPKDYDLIVTGDLGELGSSILEDWFKKDGMELKNHVDCGLLLFDRQKQDVHCGASGCGCAAGVFTGYLLQGLQAGRWKRMLFCPTGALLSPTSAMQKESIPSICHAVAIQAQGV